LKVPEKDARNEGTQNTVRNIQTSGAARAERWTSIAASSDMKTDINVNAMRQPFRDVIIICEKAGGSGKVASMTIP